MSVVIPPIVTFDNGELNDGKKLAVKILEEASELLYASIRNARICCRNSPTSSRR